MAQAAPEPAAEEPEVKLPGLPYRVYILVLLTLISAVSAVDRQILDILIEAIGAEFDLTDGQLGTLNGLAYAGVFAVAAIPLATLADRFPRKYIIGACVIFWSTATALSSQARNFVHLFIARMGVGLGEAGLSSPGPALLSDIFPARQRATIISLYMLGPPIGIFLALSVGGWVLDNYGWRTAFLIAAIPGFILGPLMLLTVRNVPKGLADGVTKAVKQPSIGATLGAVLKIPTILLMLAALAIQAIITQGVQRWIPAYLMRAQDLEPSEFGTQLGLALGAGNAIGHLIGGPLADMLGRRDMRLQFVIGIVAVLGGSMLSYFLFTTQSVDLFFWLAFFQMTIASMFAAPLIMVCTTLPPVWARATATSVTLMAVYLVGYGLAPAILGGFSDLLTPVYGDDSLQMSVLWSLFLAIPSALLFMLAARSYRKDLDKAAAMLAEDASK